ncbi:hypothetical protein J3R30DRAFT_3583285 [Lentinula aciculospora]|uniref:Uncharacterized protein n=1 Tax=Lentinula aciculospora TaxID=153920 RepID=A0A9W8ZTS4_9AGAR|nr:hypothetical protein J3R30DRAFT_3583285 [Lentinula aciculospora]
MSTYIQLYYFSASDTFINNRAPFTRGLFRAMVATTGNSNAYWGLQELDEEVRVGYLITVWHSQEDYLEYKNSNVFNLTMRLLEKAAVGKIIHHLFRGVKELTMPTFQAKLTEFVLASAKNGVSNNTLKKTVGKVWAVLDAHGHPSSIGECVNGDDVYVIVIGWPAYETMENEAFMTPINELSSLADLRFWHVPFDKYTSRL